MSESLSTKPLLTSQIIELIKYIPESFKTYVYIETTEKELFEDLDEGCAITLLDGGELVQFWQHESKILTVKDLRTNIVDSVKEDRYLEVDYEDRFIFRNITGIKIRENVSAIIFYANW